MAEITAALVKDLRDFSRPDLPERVAADVNQALDSTANPCEDFYQFACGGFVAANPVSGPYTATSTTSAAQAFLEPKLEALVVDAAKGRPWANTREARVVGNSYTRCMNAPGDTRGRVVVKELATRLDGAKSVNDLAIVLAEYQKRGSASFFQDGLGLDPADPDRYVFSLGQSFGELPDRSYYLDREYEELRAAYARHVTMLAKLVEVTVDSAAVLRVETSLAKGAIARTEQDPRARANPMTLAELAALTP